MDYEIVNLKEKLVVGLTARTQNSDENMANIIGDLWNDFYQKGIYASVSNKANAKALGIYSDYESDKNGTYSVTVGCEVTRAENISEETIVKTIPAGSYAKFIVRGNMHKAVAEFWQRLWEMDLDRSYQYDFEEYQNGDMENAEIHMYISVNKR